MGIRIDYKDLVESSPDFIAVLDQNGYYVYVNQTFLSQLGYPKEQVIGQAVWELDFVPGNMKDLIQRLFPQILSGAMREPIQTELIDSEGQTIYLNLHYRVVYKKSEPFIQLVSRNITKESLLEIENSHLQKRNQLLSTAIEQISQGVVITDAKKEDNPIIYVNSGFERMTGYNQEEILNRNCSFLQGEQTDPQIKADIRSTVDAQKSENFALLNYRKDGTPFWNELSLNPVFNEDDELINFIGIQNDVTVRKELEMELQKDLVLARTMQRLLLSSPIQNDAIEFMGFYEPSMDLGGDLYKWKKLGGDRYGLLIMDVMGHGIAAALLTMSINGEFQSLMRQGIYQPRIIIEHLNRHVFDIFKKRENYFETTPPYLSCVYMVIDVNTRSITYVNAGHPSFILRNGSDVRYFKSTMVPVGLMKSIDVKEETFSCLPGSELILYTDGVTESLACAPSDLAKNSFNETRSKLNQLIENEDETRDDLCLVHVRLNVQNLQ